MGLREQMTTDGRITDDQQGATYAVCKDDGHCEYHFDDVSGKRLDTSLAQAAREDEMIQFKSHGVYVKVPITESWRITGKGPIGVRWIDINKGDDENPETGLD